MADKVLVAGRMIRGVAAIALKGMRKHGVVTLGSETPPRRMVAPWRSLLIRLADSQCGLIFA